MQTAACSGEELQALGDHDAQIINESNCSLEDIHNELAALREVQTYLLDHLLIQGNQIDHIEDKSQQAETATSEAAFLLADAGRLHARALSNKWSLWGAGLGSGIGGVAGCVFGLAGTPAGALALGAAGMATLGMLGGAVGKTIGLAVENMVNMQIDKELIQHIHQMSWAPDSCHSKCMKCKVDFTWIKRRHHCRICGGVFCWHCCHELKQVKYRGVDGLRTQRVCGDCIDRYHTHQSATLINPPPPPPLQEEEEEQEGGRWANEKD